MALGNEVLNRLKRRVLLFEEHAALPGLANVAVDHHQRHGDRLNQRHNLLFAHMARVEHDGIALAIGQHLHCLFFTLRRIVAVGDDQLFAPGFRLARSLLQQAAKIEAVKGGNHQTDAVARAIRQRAGEKVRPIAQLFHRLKNLLAGALFHLTCAVQHAGNRRFRDACAN